MPQNTPTPTSQDIQRIYDEQSTEYARQAGSLYAWQYIEKPAWERGLHGLNLSQMTVLDVACGNGRIIEYLLAQDVKSVNLTGTDISEKMLSFAQKEFPNVHFIQSDMTKLDFPDESFDLITSALGFRYIDNEQLEVMMNLLFRMLRKGGTLFYIEGHPARCSQDHPEGYYTRGWSEEDCPWGARNPFFNRPLQDFINITANAGFRITALDEMMIEKEAEKIDSIKYQRKLTLPSRFSLRATK